MNEGGSIEDWWPWLREERRAALEAAWEWLGPRCRTEAERRLAPALLLLLSPFNALVTPCRPAAGSCINLQVTLSRQGAAGPERVRLAVRAGSGVRTFQRSGARMDRSHRPYPSDPPTAFATAPEHLIPRALERLALWLDAEAVTQDPLACAAVVLAALLDARG